MKTKEVLQRISEDPDFVYLKRFDYSLEKVLDRFPDGVPNRMIAQALMMTEEEVEEQLQLTLTKIRMFLGVEVEDTIDS